MLFKPVVRLLLAVVVVIVIAAGWFFLQVDPIFSGTGKEVVITVAPGESTSSIASDLHAQGVIASPFAFRLDLLIQHISLIRAGTYEIRQGSSFSTIRSILGNEPNVAAVTVSAGLTIHEVAVALAGVKGNAYARTFLADATTSVTSSPFANGSSSLEGLIGTGSYIITNTTTPAALVRRMVTRFNEEAKSVGLSTSTTINGLNSYQLITGASIVEKEGYYPRNMPDVARVIYNRLKVGLKLEMDATVLYALGRDGGVVTHATEETPSPYNTYLNYGLTPTPICAVSTYALNAMLHAPAGTWLYFTDIDKAGDEAFSSTFAQQLKNERIAASRGVE